MRRGIAAAVVPIARSTRRRRAVAAVIAHAAAADGVLRDPAADGPATVVITKELEGRIDRAATGQVTNDAWLVAVITLVPGLTDGGGRDAENRNRSDESEDLFHEIGRAHV